MGDLSHLDSLKSTNPLKIIVVGNSPNVLFHEVGDQINSFDVVIRINDFQIKKFKKNVGYKVTHWATSFSPVINIRPVNNFKKIFTSNVNQTDKKFLNRISRIVPPNLFKNVDILPSNELSLLKSKIGYCDSNKWPTTGLLAIHMALTRFTNSDVYIHGFSFFKESSNYVSHYWNEQKNECFKKHHDSILEENYVNYLVKLNILKKLVK
jgi:hypothetical protein